MLSLICYEGDTLRHKEFGVYICTVVYKCWYRPLDQGLNQAQLEGLPDPHLGGLAYGERLKKNFTARIFFLHKHINNIQNIKSLPHPRCSKMLLVSHSISDFTEIFHHGCHIWHKFTRISNLWPNHSKMLLHQWPMQEWVICDCKFSWFYNRQGSLD